MTEMQQGGDVRVGPYDAIDALSQSYFEQAREDFGALGDSLQPTDGLRNFRHGAILDFDSSRAMSLEEIRTNFGEKLCTNYDEMLNMLKPVQAEIETEISRRSLIITANHPTLATPTYPALALAEMFGEDIRNQIYIVIGPYPATFRVDIPGIATLDPLQVLNSMGGVLLTSPVSQGSDKHSSTAETQKQMRDNFKNGFETLAGEPGNIIIVCSGGSRDTDLGEGIRYVKEDRSKNGHKLIARADSTTLPLGIHDHVFGANNAHNAYRSRIDMIPGDMHRLRMLKTPWTSEMEAKAIQAETIGLANLAAHNARRNATNDQEREEAMYAYVSTTLLPSSSE